MVASPARLCFPPFEFDPVTGTLWYDTQSVRLKPQTAAVLCYLVEHAGQGVRQDELLAALWPDVRVGAGVLKTLMWEIRQALGDQAQMPRFIETLPRRGYRFIGLRDSGRHAEHGGLPPGVPGPALRPMTEPRQAPALVGRAAELASLHKRLARALVGERQIVFVSGEAGIGKTTLVSTFLQQLAGRAEVWMARGQCIEHYGAGEAYLPILEALGRLGREAGGKRLVRLLRQYAPTWLAHLPALMSATERDKVRRATRGVARERMLRELAEAVEVLTARVSLVLWVEDVQWSDLSTLEWIGYVARRSGPAQLLVVGTCRPVAPRAPGHPLPTLIQDLLLHGQCGELGLQGITVSAISTYLLQRLRHGERDALHALAQAIHQRTEGNPLFIVNVVEYLVAQGMLAPSAGQWDLQGALALLQQGVPQHIHQFIERQIAQLSAQEQRLLEVASVAGAEFSAAAVAAGLGTEVEDVEARCAGLARRALFVQPDDMTEWPDGTVAARYAFLHALYAHVLYECMPSSRRRAVHARLEQRLAQAYGTSVREVAAELALHCERSRQYGQAIHYLRQAGENASRRNAHTEAVGLLTRGLALVQRLPETPERTQHEIQLQFALGASLIALKGYAAPEVEHVYTRTYALCQQSGDTRHLFAALLGLSGMYHNRAEYQKVHALTEHMLGLAQEAGSATRQLWAHILRAQVLYQTGAFARAQPHYRQALTFYNSQQHGPAVSDITQDPRVHCLANLAESLWLLGYPDQALQHSQEALALAQRLAHPHAGWWPWPLLSSCTAGVGSNRSPMG